jgi:DNA-binding IclR family transcriptional regulator
MQTDLPPVDAEARSLVRRTFDRQPEAGFTVDQLASSLALPVGTVQRVLAELVTFGVVTYLDDEYVSTLIDGG